jgi:hypothetical protein
VRLRERHEFVTFPVVGDKEDKLCPCPFLSRLPVVLAIPLRSSLGSRTAEGEKGEKGAEDKSSAFLSLYEFLFEE